MFITIYDPPRGRRAATELAVGAGRRTVSEAVDFQESEAEVSQRGSKPGIFRSKTRPTTRERGEFIFPR